ncbi:hypothetical protein PFTANZ_06391 [Plasmodium falciparum Tanzania (2000708)]|uniref:EF-hand domain-containing protein n=1 Tax=Plasmodium falciparum Tanzania (2000708) TaxID=1036725 RepID=A0A024VX81_PLAFA|nr:hypothetical protein PFTANZ_06391 [Plasmodium falciparum Tanzania (2000708)]
MKTKLQQLVDRTILQADKDGDGMISFEEFKDSFILFVNVFSYNPSENYKYMNNYYEILN